mgnify:CR=1 FL=1|tara:strand:- start:2770 stop:3246 length:477 start_codon:yes stop_codon:yes gene_type:complete
MAFHRGNAFLTNVTADNLRTDWSDWSPTIDDPYATLVADPLQHARYFNTRNLVITSLHLKVTLNVNTPSPYTTIAVRLPANLRIRSDTHFQNDAIIERFTGTAERKFSTAHIIADGKTQGGADGSTFLFLDTLFVRNLGQFVAGQTYTIRGQIVFEPA